MVPATAFSPRACTAMFNAFKTSDTVMDVSIAHPKMRRLPRSMIVAKNAHPSGVGQYVISLTHARFSTPGVNARSKRLGYTGMV